MPLDRTFMPLDHSSLPLDCTYMPLDHIFMPLQLGRAFMPLNCSLYNFDHTSEGTTFHWIIIKLGQWLSVEIKPRARDHMRHITPGLHVLEGD